jgi:hypothetical protein
VGLIAGSKSWHLHVIGEVPPGLNENMIEPAVLANFTIIGALLGQVRGYFVTHHDVDPETLKQQLAVQYKKKFGTGPT